MAERSSKKGFLINCDKTYNLDVVEQLLFDMDEKHGLNISSDKLYFGLNKMAEICETTIPQLQVDFAIFVVQAHESRLSINEENAGIGYARLYKALLQATGDRVLIVIGGDDQYKDEDEEERVVISRWARRKVSSQFNEENLDGRKSFIFSWNKQHREIHQEALLHYFDPNKRGQKFEYQPKPKPSPAQKPEETRDVTPPAGEDIHQEPFVVEDDTDQLVPSGTRRRSFSDREGQRQGLTGQQEGPRYGALHQDDANLDFPAGIVLLETRMRYGKISYQANDVVQREDRWQLSDRIEADLLARHKSTRSATVKFISDGNRTYHSVVTIDTCWGSFVNCLLVAWALLKSCMSAAWRRISNWCRC